MFTHIAMVWPSTLSGFSDAASDALAGAAGELDEAGTRLSAVPALAYVHSPVAADAAGSDGRYQDLVQAILAGAHIVCVHPWCQGVGQGDSHFRYLSPANAVAAAANKFTDAPDYRKPAGNLDALVLVVSANGFHAFAQTLNTFNRVFPVADVLFCERRAQQLASVEQDKLQLPDAPINARWHAKGIGALGLTRVAGSVLGSWGASAMAYQAGGNDPAGELDALITKKQSLLQAQAQAAADLQGLFAGGVGRGAFLSGQSAAQIKNALLNSDVGHDEPLACCLVVAGAVGSLTLLREMLGL